MEAKKFSFTAVAILVLLSSTTAKPGFSDESSNSGHMTITAYLRTLNERTGINLDTKSRQASCELRLPGPNAIVKGRRVDNDALRRLLVQIQNGRFVCSGTLLNRRWVLTAAHCSASTNARVCVRGSSTLTGYCMRVSRVIRHPDYRKERFTLVNDVMLLELSSDARIGIQGGVILNMRRAAPAPGTIVRATGFGVTSSSRKQGLGTLRFVDTEVMGTQECKNKFLSGGPKFRGLAGAIRPAPHLCANHDTCDGGVCGGDSGGPIFARDTGGELVQVGITSYGVALCGSRGTPDVFARVQSYVVWIRSTTRGTPIRLIPLRAK